MKVADFTGDPSSIKWPEQYAAELEGLSPVEQLRYFYVTPDYARWTRKALDEGSFEWQNPFCLYTLPVQKVEMLDGKVAAVHHAGTRLALGESACIYSASDNNGAGYKEREDWATLVCGEPITFPRDFYEVEGDTVTFNASTPEYPYAFMHVQVKPWEREVDCPIRHVVVDEDVTFLPKYMLDGMCDLETVRVPAAVGVIGSDLPKSCQLYVGGVRVPECFVSWDGVLIRVQEDVEELCVPGAVKRIGRHAFDDCPSLKRVYIFEDNVEIEDGAFGGFAVSPEIYRD